MKPVDPVVSNNGGPIPRIASADAYAEWDDPETIVAIEAALARLGDVVRLEANDGFPERLRDARPDIVFNIAEGWGGRYRESYVPAFCEFWGVPYTGSGPLTLGLCLDKARAKEILSARGISTPAFQVVDSPGEIGLHADLPAIVKPLHEGSSLGITARSLCTTREGLREQVVRTMETFGEPVIVERFLSGREFTVAILGDGPKARALPVVEVDLASLPEGAVPVYGYEAKWIWDRPDAPLEILHCPADCEPGLRRRLEKLALAAFHALGCRDWARIDIRCDPRGEPHVLELNPLPGIIPDPAANSCYPKAARAAGIGYEAIIEAVVRSAARRYGLRVH